MSVVSSTTSVEMRYWICVDKSRSVFKNWLLEYETACPIYYVIGVESKYMVLYPNKSNQLSKAHFTFTMTLLC